MSAAATAAGYLYASGRLSRGVNNRKKFDELKKHLMQKHNVGESRAAELAREMLEMENKKGDKNAEKNRSR